MRSSLSAETQGEETAGSRRGGGRGLSSMAGSPQEAGAYIQRFKGRSVDVIKCTTETFNSGGFGETGLWDVRAETE